MSVKPGSSWWLLSLGAIADTSTEEPLLPSPGDVRELTADPSGVSVSLTWLTPNEGINTDNVYLIHRDGEYIGTSNSTSYNATGLEIETQYTFTVYSKNFYGKTSPGVSVTTTTLAAVSEMQQPTLQAVATNTVKITNPDPTLVYYTSSTADVDTKTSVTDVNNVAVTVGDNLVWAAYPGIVNNDLMQSTQANVRTIQNNCPTGGTHNCNCHSCGTHSCNCRTECVNCGCGCNGDCGCSWGQCGCPTDMWWYNPQQVCDTCTSTCCDQCPNLGECAPPAGYVKAYNQWWQILNPSRAGSTVFVLEEQSIANTFAPTTIPLVIDKTIFVDIDTRVRSLTDPIFVYAQETNQSEFLNEMTGEMDVTWETVPNEDGTDGGTKVFYPRFYVEDRESGQRTRMDFDDVILTIFDEDGDLIDITNLSAAEDNDTLVMTEHEGRYKLAIKQPDEGSYFTLDFILDNEVSKSVKNSYKQRDLEISWA